MRCQHLLTHLEHAEAQTAIMTEIKMYYFRFPTPVYGSKINSPECILCSLLHFHMIVSSLRLHRPCFHVYSGGTGPAICIQVCVGDKTLVIQYI